MKHALAATTVAFALCAGAEGRASAANLEYDWTGTVRLGVDGTGVFGPAGASLGGDAYTVRYIFDDTRGTRISDYGVENIVYNPILNEDSPALYATLTINNVSVTFNASGAGNANNDPADNDEYNSAEGPGTSSEPDYSFVTQDLFDVSYSPPTLEANFSATGLSNPDGDLFQIAENEPGGPTPQASGLLLPSMVSERVVSAAPEASTWVLIMTGIFGVGLAVRWRQRSSSISA